jgi:hypothetical protein
MTRREMIEQKEQPVAAFKLRMPTDLHAKAAEAAKARGVSLNSLIVYAIRSALEYDAQQPKVRPRDEARALLMLLQDVIGTVGDLAERHAVLQEPGRVPWTDHPWAYAQAVQAGIKVLEIFRPDGSPSLAHVSPDDFQEFYSGFGAHIANVLLVQGAHQDDKFMNKLGSLLSRLQKYAIAVVHAKTVVHGTKK